MENAPFAIYHDVYYYFELYEEYIQIHQNDGFIPYPHGLKKDGEKIHFKELKGIYFHKELRIFGDEPSQQSKVGWAYTCKLKAKNTSFKPIRNIICGDQGRQMTDKTTEYGQFVSQLMEKVHPHQPKIYTASGLMNRLDKALPFLKLNKLSPLTFGVVLLIVPLIEFTLDIFSLYNVDLGLFYAIGFTGYTTAVLAFLVNRFWKKSISWDVVEEEYLPSEA